MALSEYLPCLSALFKAVGKGDITYEVETEKDGNDTTFRVTRTDNQSALYIDPARDLMIFDNFNSFTQTTGTKTLVSTMDLPEAEHERSAGE